jgi:uncharacterized protein YrrD
MSTDTFLRADGRRVVASDDAETIGSVKGFVLDGAGRKIEAIHVDGRGRHASLLDWSSVSAFGADAVMAASSTDPSSVDNDHQLSAIKGSVTMIGSRILTIDGQELGTVVDVEFDTGSGRVVNVMGEQGAIGSDRVRSLGSYALVVDAATPSTG